MYWVAFVFALLGIAVMLYLAWRHERSDRP